MNKIITLLSVLTFGFCFGQDKIITKQGQVTFFSYTSVENIEAQNNQVLSIINLSNNEIAIQILMRAFIFKKALMEEHFNESYIESDLYPKAKFSGEIMGLDLITDTAETRSIKGELQIREIKKEVAIKTKIAKVNGQYNLSGEFEVNIKDFEIKVPPLLKPNIAENIKISFNFEYQPYEEEQ